MVWREENRERLEQQYLELIRRMNKIAYALGRLEKHSSRYQNTIRYLEQKLATIPQETAFSSIPFDANESAANVERWKQESRQIPFDESSFFADMDQVEASLVRAESFLAETIFGPRRGNSATTAA